MAEGVELATAYVSLTVETKDLAKDAAKSFTGVEREAEKSGKNAGSRWSGGMKSMVKGVAGMLGGVMAAVGVKNFLGDALGEARESQKVGALTEQVIKSTGGAAKVTAQQVGELASAISKKAGVDDEAIQTGANLLLTFKNVRNEVGAGNDIFNQATQAAVDLSAAGFGSIDSASKMLGKALNDPIKGITALSRAGVTFTQQQKDQIKTMVESGDTLGAQKMIMAELQSQVGGAAAATATAGDKAKVAMDNMKESIGTLLLPIVDKLATTFSEKIAPAIEKFIQGFQDGTGAGGKFRDVLTGVWNVIEPIGRWMWENKEVVGAFAGTILGLLVINKVTTAVKAFNIVLRANPIGLIVTAIGLLVGALVWLYKNNEDARRIMDAAWKGIKQVIDVVVKWFKETAWPIIKQVLEIIGATVMALWNNFIKPYFTFMLNLWKSVALFLRDTVWPIIRDAFKWIGDKGKALWDNFIKPAFDAVRGGLTTLKDAFVKAKDAIGEQWAKITDKVKAPLNAVKDWVNKNFITPLNKMLEKVGVSFRIPSFGTGGSTGSTSTLGGLQKFAGGGMIPGPWRGPRADNVLGVTDAGVPIARVNPREFILPVDATARLRRMFGWSGLERLRRGELPGFAGGGIVDWLKGKATDVIDTGKFIGRLITDPGKEIPALLNRLLASIPGGLWGQAALGTLRKLGSGLVTKLREGVASIFGADGKVPAGGMSSAAIWNSIRLIAPESRLTSGYRAGARTAGAGVTSMHALNRAIDIVSSDLYALHRKMAARLGTSPTELIGPIKGLNISRGTHRFGTVTNPTTLRTHKDHVHIAYGAGGFVDPFVADQGVTLAPGINVVNNKLGKPEPLQRVDALAGQKLLLSGTLDLGDGIMARMLATADIVEDFVQMSPVRSRMMAGVSG